MDTLFAERPHFFEGQYLGADDLRSLLDYLREQDARQRLAGRSWGVLSGIEIVQSADPAGAIQYMLTPGVALDGHGRLIAVLAPTRLDAALFALQPSGLVNVWLRHQEASAGGVRPGFEVCNSVDAYTRVSEGFVIEVGLRNTLAQRESGVELSGVLFADARDAPGTSLPGQPIAMDGSVAAQLFPNDDEVSRWLIPIGRVPWQQGAPGSFIAADDTAKKLSLIFRRQAGVLRRIHHRRRRPAAAACALDRTRSRPEQRPAGRAAGAARAGPDPVPRPHRTERGDLAGRAHAAHRRPAAVRPARRVASEPAAPTTPTRASCWRCDVRRRPMR